MMQTFAGAGVGRYVVPVAVALLGCQPVGVSTMSSRSVGGVTDGYLQHGVALPNKGTGFARLRPADDTRYGTPAMVEAIVRAAAAVHERFPSRTKLMVGDLSSRFGGRHPRHGSHRSGRDADLLFYARRLDGTPETNRHWLAFDRFGLAMRSGKARAFDDERNWHLVRTLIADPSVRVQWIFCADGIKSRLLRYAAEHESSARVLHRASWVLQQPSSRNPHVDHFHVRVACAPEERATGCRDSKPLWPWLTDPARKSDPRALPSADDEALVRWLVAEENLHERRYVNR